MKTKRDRGDTPDGEELRQRAEARLWGQAENADTPPAKYEAEKLLHELQVYQVELELQNEELRCARGEAEAALEKYTDLYDFAPTGYVTLARDGAIAQINLTGARLLGAERSRVLGRRLQEFVCPESRPVLDTLLRETFESRDKGFCEVSIAKPGSADCLIARIDAVSSESGLECRGVITDVTERKRDEDARLVLNKLESTGILAGGIAHDFNNLLTIIMGNIDLARTVLGPSEEASILLDEAQTAAWAGHDLTRQLITFAKGGDPLKKLWALPDLIRNYVDFALLGTKLRSEFAIADDLWMAEVDEGQLGQAIRNIVLNARDAMPEGGTVRVSAKNVPPDQPPEGIVPSQDYVMISFADRGRGISREVLSRIFDPYFSTKERGTKKGMGLGLTVCHAIISKHGGFISVETGEGTGTTFHLYLPASRHGVATAAPEIEDNLLGTGSVLVMDDEKSVREIAGTALRKMGYEVTLAANGQEAIDLYRLRMDARAPFDAVILDLTVHEGMGALEALKAILEIDPSAKVIVSSGYNRDPAILEYERFGFKAALAKPYRVKQLGATVQSLIGRRARGGKRVTSAAPDL